MGAKQPNGPPPNRTTLLQLGFVSPPPPLPGETCSQYAARTGVVPLKHGESSLTVTIILNASEWTEIGRHIEGLPSELQDAGNSPLAKMFKTRVAVKFKHGAVRVLIGQLDNAGLCELARKIEGQVDR